MSKYALKRYRNHRVNAIKRNIVFNITYDDWVAWWLANGIDKSVKSMPKYNGQTLCMCRYNDTGPYELNNIYCDTVSGNLKTALILQPGRRTNNKPVVTPMGTFPSLIAAARAHNVDVSTISIRRKSRPSEYYST